MKLTILLLIVAILNVHAKGVSQTVTLTGTDMPLQRVMASIEKQTGYVVFTTKELLDAAKPVTVSAHDMPLRVFLDIVLKGQPLEYKIENNTIVLNTTNAGASEQTGRIEVATPPIEVTGRVTDKDGSALSGASVKVKGSNTGVSTNANGEFVLKGIDAGAVIEISYVGYETQTLRVKSGTVINVTLAKDEKGLNEMVVIGYGVKSKRDLTSSISVVTAKDIEKSQQLSPQFALQGKAPGVFVSSPTTDPNDRPVVRIRGIGTLGFNEPLYVIDGIPLTEFGSGSVGGDARGQDLRGSQNVLNLINPADIESMSVLKDATATSVYGLRASNGVILIETKRGRKGEKPQITFTTETGISYQPKKLKTLQTPDYVKLIQDEFMNAYPGKTLEEISSADENLTSEYVPSRPLYLGEAPTYDWQEALLNKSAVNTNNNLSMRAGNNVSNYFLSFNFSQQASTLKFNKNKRYSLAFNSDHQLTKWLKLGETFRSAYHLGDDSRNSTGSDFTLNTLARFPAFQAIYDKDNEYGYAQIKDANGRFLYGRQTRSNPLMLGTYDWQKYQIVRNIGSFYAQVEPFQGLKIKGTVSADLFYQNRRGVGSARTEIFDVNNTYPLGSTFTLTQTQNFNLVKELSADYKKEIGNHNFGILVNAVQQKYTSTFLRGSASGIRYDDPERAVNLVANQGGTSTAEEGRSDDRLLGYLGRLSYSFSDKYYLDASFRRDGSSRFSPLGDLRYGSFYAVSGAWRISSENFFKKVKAVNDLKLRAGLGQTGNQETKPFGYTNVMNTNPRYSLGGDFSRAYGSASDDFANKDITWETSTTYNVGVDATMLNYRLNVTVEFYKRITDGILQNVPLPLAAGIVGDAVVNLGKVQNTGLELSVSWKDKINNFEYGAGLNVSTNENKVLDLYDNKQYYGSQQYSIHTGMPVGFLYGYKTDGIFRTPEEVAAYIAAVNRPGVNELLMPGDMRYRDLYGAPANGIKTNGPDGNLDFNDYEYLGKTFPGIIYGVNFTFGYKGFDTYIQFNGQADVQKYNVSRQNGENMSSPGDNQLVSTLNRWTPDNKNASMPRPLYNDVVGNTLFSDRFVENSGYLRLQNLQIGYSLPVSAKSRLGNIRGARVYVAATNLFLITKWKGLNPESDFNPQGFTDPNPAPRILSAGLSINF